MRLLFSSLHIMIQSSHLTLWFKYHLSSTSGQVSYRNHVNIDTLLCAQVKAYRPTNSVSTVTSVRSVPIYTVSLMIAYWMKLPDFFLNWTLPYLIINEEIWRVEKLLYFISCSVSFHSNNVICQSNVRKTFKDFLFKEIKRLLQTKIFNKKWVILPGVNKLFYLVGIKPFLLTTTIKL